MKRFSTQIFLAVAAFFILDVSTSCSKVEDVVDEISIPVPFTIPVNFNAEFPFATVNTNDYVTYPEIPLNIDVDAKIKDKYPAFSINNLKSAKLDNFNIEADTGNAVPLDAIKDAEVYFKTPEATAVLVAKVLDNTNTSKISFTPTDENLITLLKSKQNSFILKIRGSKVTAGEMKLKISTGFKTEVGL